MNINDISTQLLYTTVPIYAKNNNGSFSSGTGFIFSVMEQNDTSIPLLITNYHVLENAVAGFVELHIAEKGLPSEKSIRIQFNESIINGNKLGNLDLIAIPLASTLNELKQKGINIFYRTVEYLNTFFCSQTNCMERIKHHSDRSVCRSVYLTVFRANCYSLSKHSFTKCWIVHT